MTHVLIAVDDDQTSVAAARTARRIFGDDARYTVINVAPNASVMWGDDTLESGMVYPLALPGAAGMSAMPFALAAPNQSSATPDDVIDRAERRARIVADRAGLPGAQPVGDTGDAADSILAAAHDHQADVIVVGSHERGWLARLFTSSVTDSVVRDADVPVLVAR